MVEEAANSEGTARVIGRPWKPGESGNPDGRPRDQFSFMGILRAALAEKNKAGKSVGQRLVERYIKLGLAGNGQALEALMARIDGKPAQSLKLTGDDAAPLHVRHSARLEAAIPKPELELPAPEQDEVEGEVTELQRLNALAPKPDGWYQGDYLSTTDRDTDHHEPDADQ